MSIDEKPNLESVDGVDLVGEIAHFVKVYNWAREKEREYRDMAANARAEIETVMAENEVGKVNGKPAVYWPHYTETRVDIGRLRERYPDVAEAVTRTTERRRFTIVAEDEG